MKHVSLSSALVVLVVTSPAFARPVSFVGSTMAMAWGQPMQVGLSIDHTPLRWASFGGTYLWMNRLSGKTDFLGAEANFLAYRWNGLDWQANFFVSGAAGTLRQGRAFSAAGFVAAEADAESRRLYFLASTRYLRGGQGFQDIQVLARAGVAPVLAEFDQLNPWVVLQYQYMPGFAAQHVVTPMVRLLYQGFLLEVGCSLRGEWMVNFAAEL